MESLHNRSKFNDLKKFFRKLYSQRIPLNHENYQVQKMGTARFEDLIILMLAGLCVVFAVIVLLRIQLGLVGFFGFMSLFIILPTMLYFGTQLWLRGITSVTNYNHATIFFPEGSHPDQTTTILRIRGNTAEINLKEIKVGEIETKEPIEFMDPEKKEIVSKVVTKKRPRFAELNTVAKFFEETKSKLVLYWDENVTCCLILPASLGDSFNLTRQGFTIEKGQQTRARVDSSHWWWLGRAEVLKGPKERPTGCDILLCVSCRYFAKHELLTKLPTNQDVTAISIAVDDFQAIKMSAEKKRLEKENEAYRDADLTEQAHARTDGVELANQVLESTGKTATPQKIKKEYGNAKMFAVVAITAIVVFAVVFFVLTSGILEPRVIEPIPEVLPSNSTADFLKVLLGWLC